MKSMELEGLHWVQAHAFFDKPSYELRNAENEIEATLKRTSWFNHQVEVDAIGARYRFERKGILRHRLIIQSIATGDEPAAFEYRLFSGKLKFPDGRTYVWKRTDFWGSKWNWVNESGEPVLSFQTSGVLTFGASMEAKSLTADTPLSLLVYLGWYLITLFREDLTTI